MNKKDFYKRIILSVFLLSSGLFMPASDVEAAEFCSDQYYINETLDNGAKWDMCWEHRNREGIIFHHIFYTPKDGQRRMVLNFAAVAQIHVPYDDNGARYHDISDYGIGANNILSLNSSECPSGTLLKFGAKNVLCKQRHKEQFAFKSGNNTAKGSGLSLFSVSPVGAYYYMPRWRFMEDGSIEPAIGATGALQRFGNSESRGWKLSTGRIGIAHLHNFYWKLDFDLNNSSNDDVVEEINFPLVNGKRQKQISVFNTETSRKVNPSTLRQWRVRDKNVSNNNGHNVSYDILINDSGHQDIGPSNEAFTQNDFYVTKQRSGEKFASHNPSGGRDLAEFVNGESIVNDDIVIWPGVTFYHMPRNEDYPHMDTHWSHISIVPRDWHASNPLAIAPVNTPPTIERPADQSTAQNSSVNLAISANDVDGDSLNFSATGLPNGLSINSSNGKVTGTASSAGTFDVRVMVNDGTTSSSTRFNWVVVAGNNPPSVTNPGNQSSITGNAISLSIQASDSNNNSLSYSATGLPAGLQINSNTGVISGSPTTVRNNSVVVTVNDGTTSSSVSFTWNITAPTGVFSNEVSNTAISIDGSFGEWSNLNYYANDPDDVSGSNNRIDWLRASIAHSSQNVFINYQNRQNIDPSSNSGSYVSWGWSVFIDTDNNASTGFNQGAVGAEYLISGNVVERYTGTGDNWSWAVVGESSLRYSNTTAEMSFPRSFIASPSEMRVVFVGENSAFNGSATDLYPDTGYFRYQFTGNNNSNVAPVASNQQISVGSGSSISVELSATDANNDSMTYSIVQQPQNGSITGSAPNIVYTSNAGFVGLDSIRFKANDGQLDSQTAIVSINVSSSQNSDAFSNFVNTDIVIDGNISEWSSLDRFDADPNDASGNIDWKDVTFAHNNQTLYLNYRNHGNMDPSSTIGSYLAWGWQVFIDTDKQADTGYKVGALGADFIIEGSQLQKYTGTGSNWNWRSVSSLASKYNASTAELSLARSLIGNPASIRVVFAGDSSAYGGNGIDLYPNDQNNASASRQYFDYDFTGGNPEGNNRPVASTQSVNVSTGSSVNITLVGTDSDNDSLSYSVVSNPSNGTLSGAAPNLRYTPNANFVGQDTFTYNVNDGTETSEAASVYINVTTTQSGEYSNLVNRINVDGDDSDWSTLAKYTADTDDISGTNNIINWKQAATAHNSSTLYFLYDNYGAINTSNSSGSHAGWGWQTYLDTDSNSATGYRIGDIGADYIIEGTQLQQYTGNGSNWSWSNFTSVNLRYNSTNIELSFSRGNISNPSAFKVLFVGDNAASNGNAVDNYPNNLSAFTYRLSGGELNVSNRPVANDITLELANDTTLSFNLVATDNDNDTLNYRLISAPNNGRLGSFNVNGQNISYTPNANFVGKDSIRFVANDGTFDSSIKTVNFNVVQSNGNTGGSGNGSGDSGGGSSSIFGLLFFGLFVLMRRFYKRR